MNWTQCKAASLREGDRVKVALMVADVASTGTVRVVSGVEACVEWDDNGFLDVVRTDELVRVR